MKHSDSQNAAKCRLVLSMLIFGSIGIFVRYIPLPSSVIAMIRGFVGTLFLLVVVFLTKKKLSGKSIKKNLILLLLSGAAIGVNWILLFESYRRIPVATATLCYYLAPVFVIILSPLVLKEKLNLTKVLCVIMALVGMVFISGIIGGTKNSLDSIGILCAVGAAVLYSIVVMMNKFLKDISSYDSTIMQLFAAFIVILPYTLLTEDFSVLEVSNTTILLLMVVGIVNTGVAYWLYFGSMKNLKAQTIALFSYIDPMVAIILSILILKEGMNIYNVIGAVLI